MGVVRVDISDERLGIDPLGAPALVAGGDADTLDAPRIRQAWGVLPDLIPFVPIQIANVRRSVKYFFSVPAE